MTDKYIGIAALEHCHCEHEYIEIRKQMVHQKVLKAKRGVAKDGEWFAVKGTRCAKHHGLSSVQKALLIFYLL